jgi:GxxExxY protein
MPPENIHTQVLYPELSYKIMQIAFEIHNCLGPGFSEEIYEQAFIYELQMQGIPFERQKTVDVFYKGKPLGIYRLDLLIDNKIIVELKSVWSMPDLFRSQVKSYLKATGMELGILINFGAKRVEQIRVANSRK